jgi:hypothetical protein
VGGLPNCNAGSRPTVLTEDTDWQKAVTERHAKMQINLIQQRSLVVDILRYTSALECSPGSTYPQKLREFGSEQTRITQRQVSKYPCFHSGKVNPVAEYAAVWKWRIAQEGGL